MGTMRRDGITRLFCGHPPAGVAHAALRAEAGGGLQPKMCKQ